MKNGFRNIHGYEKHTFLDFIKWRWGRKSADIPSGDSYNFPLAENNPEYLRTNRTTNTLTWIGHATVLLQLAGKNILTDPVFSARVSPVQWAGPERVVVPGIALADLPGIDLVVISHDHYDALDKASIKALSARPGGSQTLFVVPLGLGNWLRQWGAKKVVELDWWQHYTVEGMDIIAAPVQHWSNRSLWGRNKTLWAGWIVIIDEFRFFFTGDSGYAPYFKEIGGRYGPFDLAAIPIGAYEPRWFMGRHHVNPHEAVRIHQDIGSKRSVAIHWGTFILTDEPLDEPPRLLVKALEEQNIPNSDFQVLKHGQSISIE